MAERIRTIYRGGTGELVEKKSRFLATVRLVEQEEEVISILEAVRKKYYDARHHCFAYVLGEKGQKTMRASDDGEPSGTAGRPMLDILLGEGLTNVLVVVTRYFGGTLLGTGGLVRAYSGAVREGLKNSVVIEKVPGRKRKIFCDYNGIGKIQYLLAENSIPVLQTEYTDSVTTEILLPLEEENRFLQELTEATNGRAKTEAGEEVYFAVTDGKLLVGEDLRKYKNLSADE